VIACGSTGHTAGRRGPAWAACSGTPPLRTYDDIAALGREVVARGFTALKTNMVIPGDPATVYFPGFASGINTTDGAPTVEILDAIDRLIGTFRQAVGPKVGICLDLNYNFRTEGVLRIAKLLEKYDLQWLEYDNWDPDALLQIKQSTSTRLASCESLVSVRQYRPFLEKHAVDVAIIDVPWNGFSQSVQIGRLAEACEINIAPHNYYSHLADLHSLHLCAVLPNVRIMEIDIDDVPWKGRPGDEAAGDSRRSHLAHRRSGLGRRRQREGAGRAPMAAPRRDGVTAVLWHGPDADDGASVGEARERS
jgi:L-alanine-DL-glutamate epimerase-like enolase superfamily enzyme